MIRRWLTFLVITIAVGGAAGWLLPLPDLKGMAPVFLALFGVLTGFLVNAMMRTATALEGHNLKAADLRQISKALKDQQAGWHSLFRLFGAVIILLIGLMVSPDSWTISFRAHQIDLSPVGVSLFAALATLALLRSLSILSGIEALQDLRSNLLIEAAEQKEKEARAKALAEVTYRPGPVSSGYGRKVKFPG